ncbi:hypothetical protein PHLCEN_2v6367 [Hermanssonia centrifuga]|uniref:Uncharacterized protein n=1 Tax=Hermanssonia centrifuga TaxID=98765 RepID=A0A2R6NZN8_9APHY|nr:hypothetical protein PHLCEN_2v6367 [Hermanssonia centrifuga]
MSRTFFNTTSVLQVTEESWQVVGTRIEFSLQVIDNAYMSILFLRKVWMVGGEHLRYSFADQGSYNLRTLFWLASSNFVFPVLLSLAQFILLFVDPAYTREIFMAILFYVNDIVDIICALLATLWVASNRSASSDSKAFSQGVWSALWFRAIMEPIKVLTGLCIV